MPSLLDMQEPNGLPSMMDMVSANRPQMMPTAPSIIAGAMYGQDQAQYDQMVKRAMVMAEMKAKMDAQKADEFGAAAPGRMDEIMMKNKIAKDALNDPNSLEAPKVSRAEQVAKGKSNIARDQMGEASGYLNAWAGAETPAQKAAWRNWTKKLGAQYRGMNLWELPDEELDSLRKAQTNTDKSELGWATLHSKEMMNKLNNLTKVEVETLKGLARIEVAEKMRSGKPLSPMDQALTKYMKGEELNPQEDSMIKVWSASKFYQGQVGAAKIQGDILPTPGGGLTRTEPDRPQPPAMAPPGKKSATDGKGGEPMLPPPAGLAKIDAKPEGTPTQFGNGQVWTKQNGQYVRIK